MGKKLASSQFTFFKLSLINELKMMGGRKEGNDGIQITSYFIDFVTKKIKKKEPAWDRIIFYPTKITIDNY